MGKIFLLLLESSRWSPVGQLRGYSINGLFPFTSLFGNACTDVLLSNSLDLVVPNALHDNMLVDGSALNSCGAPSTAVIRRFHTAPSRP